MREQININVETLKRLKNDDEFYNYFIENIEEILTTTKPFNFYVLEDYFEDSTIKKLIMKKNNIPKLIKKAANREDVLNFLLKQKKAKPYIKDFFMEQEPGVDIEFSDIIRKLKRTYVKDSKELLKLIVDNIDNILLGSGEYLPETIQEIYGYLHLASKEQIETIDSSLARNIDVITNFPIDDLYYDFTMLKDMEKFKDEIRKRGKKFFINFPLFNSIEECQEISTELFGDFDEESFATMMFGNKDENKAKLICEITKDLLRSSKSNKDVKDIRAIGNGSYSEVYQIGDYALKIGRTRGYEQIPNHRRILQPIIRRNVKNSNSVYEEQYCVEVQNLVDNTWKEKMTPEEIEEELYKIYADMREDGIVWFDISEQNVGRLLRTNNPNFHYTDVDGTKKDIRPDVKATGMGEKNSKRTLEKGECVVIDTDYIAPYDKKKMNNHEYPGPRAQKTYDFEKRYLKEQEKREKEER